MTAAPGVLAAWLTPAVWLAMPALVAGHGADGLWVALALVLAPLVALAAGPTGAPGAGGREPLFPVAVLLLAVSGLLWANLVLAGDVAAWLGHPRWHGIALAATAGWLATLWRGARRAIPALLLLALVALGIPLAALARATALTPVEAWARVASAAAFRFQPSSLWVTRGRQLGASRGHAPIAFEEEHRVTAVAAGVLRARTVDGPRAATVEWDLEPGQSVTLRPGDVLDPSSTAPVRFEPGKRVPGAPRSGVAWADGPGGDWLRRGGLVATLLIGAVALLRARVAVPLSRRGVALLGGGLLAALLWAEGWAVSCVLAAPDLLLGGVTLDRLLDVRPLGLGAGRVGAGLQALLLAGGIAGFVASSVALRERLSTLDPTGAGEIGHDRGLWTGVFALAAAASLWPVDPWWLTILVLGGAGAALAPAALWPPPAGRPGTAAAAGWLGLGVFAAAAAAGHTGWGAEGPGGILLASPALAGALAGAVPLWIGRRGARG